MALTQTRRSISVRGATYDSLRKFCDQNDRSMSDVVEELLANLFGKAKPIHARTGVTLALVKKAPVAEKPAVVAKPAAVKAEKPPVVKATSIKTAPKQAPRQLIAAKVVKAPLPAKPDNTVKNGTVGRPAPTAAAVALSNTRRAAASTSGKGDYRGIRF